MAKRLVAFFLVAVVITYWTILSAHQDARSNYPRHAFNNEPVGITATTPVTHTVDTQELDADSLETVRHSLEGFLSGMEAHLGSFTEAATHASSPAVPDVPPGMTLAATASAQAAPAGSAAAAAAAAASAAASRGWFGGFGGQTPEIPLRGTSGGGGRRRHGGVGFDGGGGGGGGDESDESWCAASAAAHSVVPGSSWGSLNAAGQVEWGRRGCDRRLLAMKTSSAAAAPGHGGGGSGNDQFTHLVPVPARPESTSSSSSDGSGGSGAVPALASKEESWCRDAMWKFDVRPGNTWGKLTAAGQGKWRSQGCDDLVTKKAAFVDPNKLATCGSGSGGSGSALAAASPDSSLPLVAVCCGTTTRKVSGPQLSKLALFRYLLPSMAHTLECGLRYVAVVGYDKGDPFYDSLHGQMQVEQWFKEHMGLPFAKRGLSVELAMVQVDNKLKKPGPVFNKITKHAYDIGADYIYRVNDDTEMASPWAHAMIKQLKALPPPALVGAVGPLCKQGNVKILTHDFTHRTHMEVFGHKYYPDELVDWWMDDWISRVYGSKRTRQGSSVIVVHHTGAHGQRYVVDKSNKRHLERLLEQGKKKIVAYMKNSLGADDKAVQAVLGDRFTGHPFVKF